MWTKNLITAILFLALMSCHREERLLLRKAEKVLPGSWLIESIDINPDPILFHDGAQIINDTILYDVGIMQIPEFSTDSLELGIELRPLVMRLEINDKAMQVNMDRLFLTTDDEYFVYWRTDENADWSGEEGKFVTSSELFDRNHVMEIIDDDHIEFVPANGDTDQRITLIRE